MIRRTRLYAAEVNVRGDSKVRRFLGEVSACPMHRLAWPTRAWGAMR